MWKIYFCNFEEIIILIKWLVSVTAGLLCSIFYAEFLRWGRWWQQPVQCRGEGKPPEIQIIYVKFLNFSAEGAGGNSQSNAEEKESHLKK